VLKNEYFFWTPIWFFLFVERCAQGVLGNGGRPHQLVLLKNGNNQITHVIFEMLTFKRHNLNIPRYDPKIATSNNDCLISTTRFKLDKKLILLKFFFLYLFIEPVNSKSFSRLLSQITYQRQRWPLLEHVCDACGKIKFITICFVTTLLFLKSLYPIWANAVGQKRLEIKVKGQNDVTYDQHHKSSRMSRFEKTKNLFLLLLVLID